MADTDTMGLIVKLEAQTKQLQKDFDRASAIQAKAARQMEAKAKASAEKIEGAYSGIGGRIGSQMTASFKKLALPLVGGFAGGLAGGALSAILGSTSTDIRGMIADIGDLNDAAQRIGVSTDLLQGLQFGFKQSGVEVNETTAALEKFTDGIGQAAQGEGTLKTVFDRAGISIRKGKWRAEGYRRAFEGIC